MTIALNARAMLRFAGTYKQHDDQEREGHEGAHDGAVIAMVTDSLTPMTMPAMSGPSARPNPPSITAANTTPIHV